MKTSLSTNTPISFNYNYNNLSINYMYIHHNNINNNIINWTEPFNLKHILKINIYSFICNHCLAQLWYDQKVTTWSPWSPRHHIFHQQHLSLNPNPTIHIQPIPPVSMVEKSKNSEKSYIFHSERKVKSLKMLKQNSLSSGSLSVRSYPLWNNLIDMNESQNENEN